MNITKGLKFTSVHFAMKAEVAAVREDKNEVDIILTSSSGDGWIETWNLQHVKWGFEKKEYKIQEVEKISNNYMNL